MIRLGVVARIGHHTAELRPLGCFGDQRPKLIDIRLGTSGLGPWAVAKARMKWSLVRQSSAIWG